MSATPAQIAANQANAQLSTGPRTTEGKAVCSHNAMKFGLTSKQIVLPNESIADFEALHASLAAQLQPANDTECMLLDNIVAAEWRFRRVESAQNAWLAKRLKPDSAPDEVSEILLADEVRRFQKYAASYRRERESCWRKLAAMQNERRAEEQRQDEARRQAELHEYTRRQLLQMKANWEKEDAAEASQDDPATLPDAATAQEPNQPMPRTGLIRRSLRTIASR